MRWGLWDANKEQLEAIRSKHARSADDENPLLGSSVNSQLEMLEEKHGSLSPDELAERLTESETKQRAGLEVHGLAVQIERIRKTLGIEKDQGVGSYLTSQRLPVTKEPS